MLKLTLAALGALSLSSCLATAGDIERVNAKVQALDLVLKDPLSTKEEVDDALDDLKDESAATTEELRRRQEVLEKIAEDAGVSAGTVGAIATGITGIAGVLFNLYRNQRGEALAQVRKEEIKGEVKTEIRAGV